MRARAIAAACCLRGVRIRVAFIQGCHSDRALRVQRSGMRPNASRTLCMRWLCEVYGKYRWGPANPHRPKTLSPGVTEVLEARKTQTPRANASAQHQLARHVHYGVSRKQARVARVCRVRPRPCGSRRWRHSSPRSAQAPGLPTLLLARRAAQPCGAAAAPARLVLRGVQGSAPLASHRWRCFHASGVDHLHCMA